MKTRLRILPNSNRDNYKRLDKKSTFSFRPRLRSVKSSWTNVTELSEDDHRRDEESDEDAIGTSNEITEVVICQDESLYYLGIEEYQNKRFEKAIDYLGQALKSNGNYHYLVLWSLLNIYIDLKQMEPDTMSHRRNAKRYFDKLRPHVSKLESPLKKSALALEYFVQRGEWRGAIELAKKMEASSSQIACFHYQRGIDANASTALSIECMSKCLALRPPVGLVVAAHGELIKLYAKSGNYTPALEHHEERLGHLKDKEDITKAYCEEGELYLALDDKESALVALEKGLKLKPTSKILLEAKADLLFFLDKVDESLALHEDRLSKAETPLEKSKCLYTMGRICHKSGRRKCAIEYYQRELQITQQILGETHLECSRIFHDLAKIADEACEYDETICYLKQALEIEGWNLAQVKDKGHIECLMRDTQKTIGKVHFKKGDFSLALKEVF
eukprot:CAMPEP_0194239926 /NCGR_PEP_ID=MMETSP0158-20130606/6245_1 /TAXON_ID=33649 /ORGANISM="Thalassionema nitzschioides, Strain L26-B" /LENGTH=445 /DNA_ID=CAMNT_0038974511 /DNA_START=117 /DNA_END=1454 /DNA_ORIENTATION=+